jgi:hypothetical protein
VIASSLSSVHNVPLETVMALLENRAPRESARAEVRVKSVPIRTCYETLLRITGPREAVLDYAAVLFADDAESPARASPPLTLEEAHAEDAGLTLSLLLSRGMYAMEAPSR